MSSVSIKQVAEALGVNKSNAVRRAKREAWLYTEEKGQGGKRRLYALNDLPEDVRKTLAVEFPELFGVKPKAESRETEDSRMGLWYDRDALWSAYNRAPDDARQAGDRRAKLLKEAMVLNRAGHTKQQAFDAVAEKHGEKSGRTVTGWYYGPNSRRGARDYDPADWPAALITSYEGRHRSTDYPQRIYQLYRDNYLRPEQPSSMKCYRDTLAIAKAEGLAPMPSEAKLRRRLKAEVPVDVIVLEREGLEALHRTAPAQRRDHSVFKPMEGVNADGHKFDVFIRWADDDTTGRPMLVAWQDIFSGKILSWRLNRTENADGYRLSFGDMAKRFGIPHHAYLDNGRGIASKYMTGGSKTRYRYKIKDDEPMGVLTTLGVEVHWARPYHGQSKPIERAWRDLCSDIAKDPVCTGAYAGNSPANKPANYGERVVDEAEFRALVEHGINAHNARVGRQSKVCAGRSFDQAFDEAYDAAVIRMPTASQRTLWLLTALSVRADRAHGAFEIHGNRYWSDCMSGHKGERITVRFDPDYLHRDVYAYSQKGKYIGAVTCARPVGFNDEQAAKAQAKFQRKRAKTAKALADMDRKQTPLEIGRQIPRQVDAPEPPAEQRVVRGVFGQGDGSPERYQPVKRVANGDADLGADDGDEQQQENFNDFMDAARKRWIQEHI